MTNTQLEQASRNAADITQAQQALYLTGIRRGLLGHLYIFFCSKLQLMTGCDMSAGVIFWGDGCAKCIQRGGSQVQTTPASDGVLFT